MNVQPEPLAGLLVVISGPSGVGKSTIAHHVEQALGGQFGVSVTTRAKTDTDREGVDYFFVDQAEFERRRDHDELLEWANVFGNYYGTPHQPVVDALAAGKLMLLEIDVQGAEQVKAKMPCAFSLFILPPGEQALLQRLRHRGRDDEQVIQNRFAKARDEIDRAHTCGVYDHFIVNDDLAQARNEAVALVKAEWEKRCSV